MTREKIISELELALLDFVKRVAKSEATAREEIEALPAAANALVELLSLTQKKEVIDT